MKAPHASQEKTSATAAFTCLARACAHREKDERFRGPDHLARIFLSAPDGAFFGRVIGVHAIVHAELRPRA